MPKVRAHVVYPARNAYRIALQGAHLAVGVHADDVEPGARIMPPDLRQDLPREPYDSVHIRPIIHGPGENDRMLAAHERRLEPMRRGKILAVHAVLDCDDAIRAAGGSLREELRFFTRHEQASLGPCGNELLEGEEPSRFAPVER